MIEKARIDVAAEKGQRITAAAAEEQRKRQGIAAAAAGGKG